MTRSLMLVPMIALALLGAAAPAASAAKLTYEPMGDVGTYVLAADPGGGDLILSGVRRNDYDLIQLQYEGGTIDYSQVPPDYCGYFEGDSRLYCGVVQGEGFRYEGTDAVDELSIGSEGLYPWLPVTFIGRGGTDRGMDDSDVNTAPRIWDGGPGNDRILAYTGADRLLGGDGNDVLEATAGSQELRGGAGNDVLRGDSFAETYSGDIIDGGEGFDEGDYWSRSDDGNPTVNVTQDGAPNDGRPGEGDNVTSIEKIHTSAQGSFEGTQGNDDFSLYGSAGPKTATLLGGNDKFDGSNGQETVDGGPGNDDLAGSFGHDTITGGPGQDVINGDGGSYCGFYSCSVPFGNDVIHVRDGEADTVECGVGQDTVNADAIDTVAPSCETVNRASGGGGGPGGPGGTVPGGTTPGAGGTATPEAVALTVLGRRSIRALVRSGFAFQVSCGGACAVKGRLVHKGRTIATGSKSLLAAGKAKVVAKVPRRSKRAVRRLKRVRLTLKVTIQDAAGKKTSVSKVLGFTR